MDDKHKEALSRRNRGNNNSSLANREKNKLFKQIINEVIGANNYSRAVKVVESLVQKAEDGDLRATEIILDRVDGKVVQENKIDAEHRHQMGVPVRVITGIPDGDEDPDGTKGILMNKPQPAPVDEMESIQQTPTPEHGLRKVTPEQAEKENELGWKGISVTFVEPKPRDADGNLIDQDDV